MSKERKKRKSTDNSESSAGSMASAESKASTNSTGSAGSGASTQSRESAPQESKHGLPTWSKILVSLVVLGFSVSLALCCAGIIFVQDLTLKSVDPQYIARTARRVAEFPAALPAGYEYKNGVDIGPMAIVKLEHAASKQQILLMTAYEPGKEDEQQLLAREFDMGINTPFMSAKFKELKKKGVEQLDGLTMPYMVGKAEDALDRAYEGLIGYIRVGPHKTVKVYALQPDGELQLDVTFELLKKIKWV